MQAENSTKRVAGDGLTASAVLPVGATEAPERGLVVDASAMAPRDWDELENELASIFIASRRAREANQIIIYVLHGPSLYGHGDDPLRAMLATGLLGGMRSLAIEGRRGDLPAHAVTLADESQIDAARDVVSWLLEQPHLTGQLIHCDLTHVGRPPA